MYLCIDVGGTKTLIALLSSSGKLLHSVRFATSQNQNNFYKNLLQQITINFTLDKIRAVSIALPGPIKHQRAEWLGNLPWKDLDLVTLLKRDLNKSHVFIQNDASAATLAEARKKDGTTLYLTFSTGIGGGIAKDGALLPRSHTFEPGHAKYRYEGQDKEWEDLASAAAIRQHFGRFVDEITDKKDWRLVVDRLLLGLVPLTASVKPRRIIFGGPLGLALGHHRAPLRRALKNQLPAGLSVPRLLRAKYKEFSVIYGCYFYAKAKLSLR